MSNIYEGLPPTDAAELLLGRFEKKQTHLYRGIPEGVFINRGELDSLRMTASAIRFDAMTPGKFEHIEDEVYGNIDGNPVDSMAAIHEEEHSSYLFIGFKGLQRVVMADLTGEYQLAIEERLGEL
ncbi:MAG: hypothetical protein ACR2FM_03475 [Candidatus Saccharimonadales bacterium]